MKYVQLTMAFAPSYTNLHTHSKAISKMLNQILADVSIWVIRYQLIPADDSRYWILPPDVEHDFNCSS